MIANLVMCSRFSVVNAEPGQRRRMRWKRAPWRMPDLDGVQNYATRYHDIYWDGTLEMLAFVKRGLVTMTHKNLHSLV